MKKILSFMLILMLIVAMTGCASWDRFTKSLKSDVDNGLNRNVTIYSQDGTVIKNYTGKLDVEDTQYGNKVLFDLDGKRVIWYNATVCIEEL